MDLLAHLGLKVGEILLPTLATAIASLLVALLTRKLQSAGIQLTEQQQQQLKVLAADAIRAAEEASRRDPTLNGADKTALATATIAEKRPDLKPAEIQHVIDATLPIVRPMLTPKPSTPATLGR